MQSVLFEIIYHYKWNDNSTSDIDKTYNIRGDKYIEIEKVSDTFHDYFSLFILLYEKFYLKILDFSYLGLH